MKGSYVTALVTACVLAVPPVALKVSRYQLLSRVDKAREARLIELLKSGSFDTRIEYLRDGTFAIRAERGACVMDLREVAPSGYDRAATKAMAVRRHLFYVDSGIASREQPVWRTWAYFHLRRFASFVGWPISRRLTFAVTQDLSCSPIDWSKLSTVVIDTRSTAAIRLEKMPQFRLSQATSRQASNRSKQRAEG